MVKKYSRSKITRKGRSPRVGQTIGAVRNKRTGKVHTIKLGPVVKGRRSSSVRRKRTLRKRTRLRRRR